MRPFAFPLIIFFLVASVPAFAREPAGWVNPFIGTKGTGHTFPGATVPFGLAQPSPDTGNAGWAYTGGYQFDDPMIMGFSQTHLSGVGIPDLGDILLQPFTGTTDRAEFKSRYDKRTEQASPGYYAVTLTDFGVRAELTASEHVAFHRYRFGKNREGAVLLDFQHGMVWQDVSKRVIASNINRENNRTISGFLRTTNWVERSIFFTVEFDRPFANIEELPARAGEKAPRFVLKFRLGPNRPLQVKIGLSTVGTDGAKANLAAEIPHWDFDRTRREARTTWNGYLGRVAIEADPATKEIFYTALYHLLIHPTNLADVDGRYRAANDTVRTSPYKRYYSTLSLWDTYRAVHPLLTILAPERVDGLVGSMVEHAEVTGFLPIWPLWDQESFCMIGNHAIPVVADAWLKGFRGFDGEKAFAAVRRTATVSRRNSDWDMYDRFGYYPFDLVQGNEAQTVSRALEAGYDDACAARMAAALGKTADAAFFEKRARYYLNLLDPETGLMRGRDSRGAWRAPFDPFRATSPLNNPGDYTEANAWQYSFASQHAFPDLIERQGGKTGFRTMLDRFFEERDQAEKSDQAFLGQEGLIGQYAHGNEPSHHIAYLYKLTDQGWKTDRLIRRILTGFYRAAPDGVTGNEDCGQMSAWYVFSALGFYPVDPVSGEYVLGAPLVRRATVRLQGGRTLRISAPGNAPRSPFVGRVTWNGKDVAGPTVSHAALVKGGTLTFDMRAAHP